MRKNKSPVSKAEKKKKRQKRRLLIASILLRIVGSAILLLVIAVTASVVVPQIRGFEVYHILSGSMEPTIPVGSVVYIDRNSKPEKMKEKDIIAFSSEGDIVVHRLVQNRVVEGLLRTKGDANEQEDLFEIPYKNFRGKVVKHFPYVGQIMMIFTTGIGKFSVLCFAACGALMNILAGRLSEKRKS